MIAIDMHYRKRVFQHQRGRTKRRQSFKKVYHLKDRRALEKLCWRHIHPDTVGITIVFIRCIANTVFIQVKALIIIPIVAIPYIPFRCVCALNRYLCKIALETVILDYIPCPVIEERNRNTIIGNQII